MNHPGIIFTLFWLLVLLVSPSVLDWKNATSEAKAVGYVCPPCACQGHGIVYDIPTNCQFCEMPLIAQNYPKVPAVEWAFSSEPFFNILHHKLFYPAYFLAIFLGLFTVWRNRHDPQTIFFMIFFLAYILYAFKSQLSGTGHSMRFSARWFFFPGTFLLATGPALWLYGQQYNVPKRHFGIQDSLHFLPALLVMVLTLILFVGKPAWRAAATYNSFDHYLAWAEQVVFLVSGTYYGWQTWKGCRQRAAGAVEVRSWFMVLLGAHAFFVVLWALMLAANFLLYNGMSTSLEYHLIWLYTALFALAGTYQIIARKALIFPQVSTKEQRLEASEMELLKGKLSQLMKDEKPYLDPDLSLQSLADRLGIKEKELSELLNAGLDTSFYAFVNTYRLQEVRTLLLDPDKQHLTNQAIAEEAGFSSRSTFFNLFKKHFGTTPGAFKKAHSE